MARAKQLGLSLVLTCGIAVTVTSVAHAKARPTPTGPIEETCENYSWITEGGGGPQPGGRSCAILWWDASTRELSARCTVEYSFSGVTTRVDGCVVFMAAKARKAPVETVAASPTGDADTSSTGQTYTFSTSGVKWVTSDLYFAEFAFQPSTSTSKGIEVHPRDA